MEDNTEDVINKNLLTTKMDYAGEGLLPTPFNRIWYNTNDTNDTKNKNACEPPVKSESISSADESLQSSHSNNEQDNVYKPVIDVDVDGDGDDTKQMINYGTEIPSYNVAMDEIEDLLAALTVLSGLKQYEKLTWIEDGVIIPNVQVSGPFRFIRRIYNIQNRTDMIDKLKKIIYKSIAAFKYSSAESRIKTGLISCITGLNTLALTYSEDRLISSQIVVIIQNIHKSISESI